MGADNFESSKKDEIEIIETMEKFGKYQKVQYFYACISAIFITMIHINYVFVAGDLNYRCRIPECENQYAVYNVTWWPSSTIDRCTRPKLKENFGVGQKCTNESFTHAVEECADWVFETNNTVIATLNLACQPWKSNLIGTIHNVGMLLAGITSGWLTDRFGRKPTLIICSVGSCIGHLKTFTSSYYLYVFIEMLEAAVAGGSYTAAMVLMIEIGGKKNRILSGVLFAYAVYMGESLFACIAMFVPDWKNLIRIIYSPPIVFITYIFLLKESPRWQILNGRAEDAKSTLLHIAQLNNININKQNLANMNAEGLKKELKIENYELEEGYSNVLKSKEILKRVLIGAFCRFTASFVYYGLMVNSVYLPGNQYTNFMLSTVMSYPGELISMYLMNRIGRKLPMMYGYFTCGVLCVASGWIPEEYTWLKISSFLFGKLLVSICYTGVITYTMELFPTSVRGTLLGVCALASSTGNMFAPLTPILNTVSVILPSMFFGGFAIISGALLTQTPETKDLPLIDTIEQVERSAKLKERRRRGISTKGEDNYGFDNNIIA
ncbi:unnamed protein product [Parnassius apollo]|uniref:(apollo) hypothetical protein n=1 Tax=Parnassius apollo TaxID=110799 RepID=A0A8S3WEY7_PARAO|nr:unnamed protein product [Parnassius apollo]